MTHFTASIAIERVDDEVPPMPGQYANSPVKPGTPRRVRDMLRVTVSAASEEDAGRKVAALLHAHYGTYVEMDRSDLPK